MDYWRYYENDYDWIAKSPHGGDTVEAFRSLGVQEAAAQRLIASGYVVMGRAAPIVVDRYYEGALSSVDGETRLSASMLDTLEGGARSKVWVKRASSMREVRDIVEDHASERKLLFRGQSRNYSISRALPNPRFVTSELGEISLLPSLWRTMVFRHPNSYVQFVDLTLLEWSSILYSNFDMAEVRRRERAVWDFPMTMSEMEESDDPLLREFGQLRMDLGLNFDLTLAPVLSTLLQHYGLLSPVLDLTDDLDTALFFATHKFARPGKTCTYAFQGTNERQAVVYLLNFDPHTMRAHVSEENVIRRLNPLRPIRQRCHVATTDTYCINLPADFLIGAILLDFDLASGHSLPAKEHLFPSKEEDSFLRALASDSQIAECATFFG